MIDTVRYARPYRLKPGAAPNGWEDFTKHGSRSRYSYSQISLKHEKTDLRATFRKEGVSIEVSLPRLLFGKNGRLISTQQNLDAAIAKADKLMCEIAEPVVTIPKGRRVFNRVDLVWQVQGNINDFIEAHRHLTHPALQRGKGSEVYYRETIRWAGTGCNLSIYDKLAEMKKKPGDIVRIELQLSKHKLAEILGKGAPVKKLSIEQCYRVFRQILLRLHPQPLVHVTTQTDIHYWAAKNNWQIRGRPAVDVLLEGYSEKRRKEANRRILSYRLLTHKIDWRKLLPKRMPQVLLVRNGCSFTAAQHKEKPLFAQ